MMNTSRLQKDNKATDRTVTIQPVYVAEEPQWTTPIKPDKLSSDLDQTKKNMFAEFREEETADYSQCLAAKMYQNIVLNRAKEERGGRVAGQFQFEWMQSKTPAELLANVLTNKSRMNVYVHYLLNQIYLNEQANILNNLHEEEVRPYNPSLN